MKFQHRSTWWTESWRAEKRAHFLNFTIRQDYFQVDGTTLLISCEEGEEEYDEKDLLKYHTVLETIEEPKDLTLSTLRAFEKLPPGACDH